MRLDATDIHDLEPLVREVIRIVLEEIEQHDDGRVAYSEAEAASLLGVQRHVLRDARLRGEITARKVGKEFRYTRAQLLRFVEGNVKGK